MAIFNNALKLSPTNILIGVGVALAAPILLPAVGAVTRPVARMLIKGCLVLADTVKEYATEAGEQVSDLVAEAKAERASGASEAKA